MLVTGHTGFKGSWLSLWLARLGAEVTVCGPPTMVPGNIARLGVKVEYDLRKAVAQADVLNILRIQLERGAGTGFPSNREYHRLYGVTEEVVRGLKPEAFIMHPGPMNRGVEIDGTLADDINRSVIQDQVEMGVAVRMAAMDLLARNLRARRAEGKEVMA